MSGTADVQNELAKLRSDLAALREEFDKVVRIDRDDDGKVCNSQVRSNFVVAQALVIESESRKMRGMIGSDDDGAFISLLGKDDQTRVMVRVTGNEGTVEIFGDNNEHAVHIFADENRQGNVAVLSPGGIPRAIMKGMANGGAITAVGPEGQPRALMHSLNDKGEVAIIRDKVLAKMFAEEAGGAFGIADKEGMRACSLIAGLAANGLFINSPGGEQTINLAATAVGSSLSVGHLGEGENQSAAVELHDLPGFGEASFVGIRAARSRSTLARREKAARLT